LGLYNRRSKMGSMKAAVLPVETHTHHSTISDEHYHQYVSIRHGPGIQQNQSIQIPVS